MSNDISFGSETGMDVFLQGQPLEGDYYSSVQKLVRGEKEGLQEPVVAGLRVAFVHNVDSIFSYPDLPAEGGEGTVVTVKTSSGNVTMASGSVFVLWDDGVFRTIHPRHLRRATTTKKLSRNFRMVVADLGDISGLFTPVAHSNELVHKATRDLWSFRNEGSSYVLERLFDDTGTPLKV